MLWIQAVFTVAGAVLALLQMNAPNFPFNLTLAQAGKQRFARQTPRRAGYGVAGVESSVDAIFVQSLISPTGLFQEYPLVG